ncbi:putative Hydroxyproline-rich glycoprotein family protein [Quillaja saponaria]|uniref:Hydroxyproline-rich glycoprotein family protein n=1 Tax=Quillaja saponaria TaxID=32244 RepID=A0AAD7PD78_QUISA|nr:putative Hydroxyproline-rich glycoprotein family protein [Quillaja saponaria]
MADSSPYTKSHFVISEVNSPIQPNPITQGKSYTQILCKSLFFVLFLIVLPLFPSQAPEFVKQSIVSRFWELLHLLFIGIAVSYGLFSRRRNVELDFETHTKIKDTPDYVSKIFPVSSIFEDGYENSYGSDEKRAFRCWNSQYFEGETMSAFCKGSIFIDEQCKPHLSNSKNGLGTSIRYDETNVVQAWNSEYFQSDPVVIVAQPNYTVDEFGEVVGYRSLGLPVRSLKSRARNSDSHESVSGNESGSGSRGSSKSSNKSRDRIFGDLGPSNLEQKFDEAVTSASPIPWRSRSVRMETKQKYDTVTGPSHFRALSVDETQFEVLSSQSFQSSSLSSQTSFFCSSGHPQPNSSENKNLGNVDLRKRKSFNGSSSSGSPSPQPNSSENKNLGDLDFRKRKSFNGSSSSGSPSPPADRTQFESLNSESFRSKTSMSSQSSLYSSIYSLTKSETRNYDEEDLGENKSSHCSSPSGSPSSLASMNEKASLNTFHSRRYSMGSLLPDDMKKKAESDNDLGGKSSYYGSSPSGSPSSLVSVKGKASLDAFHSRRYSIGSCSSLQDNIKGKSESDNELKGLNGSRREDSIAKKESGLGFLEPKPAGLTRAPLKGKSVRTIRPGGLTPETQQAGEIISNQIDGKVGKYQDTTKPSFARNDKMKNGGLDHLMKGTSKPNLDTPCPKPRTTSTKYQKRNMQHLPKRAAGGFKEDPDCEPENFQLTSDKDAMYGCVNDAGSDSNEVDKKAGEFIARFREQIRLQKVASIERSRGQRTRGTILGDNAFPAV